MTPPLDDETVEALKRTPPPRDVDAAPEEPHSGYVVLPPDSRPLDERWPTLAAFEAEIAEKGISMEAWGEMEQEGEDA